jgi:hypothetical protein
MVDKVILPIMAVIVFGITLYFQLSSYGVL